MTKYDVFVSYRRVDSEGRTSGRDIARTIKLELEKRGYRVFFDYSEIKDNEFENSILPSIRNSKVFIIVLSLDALLRCVNEEDWVRRDIETAINVGCKIIPVSPDGAFNGWPANLPDTILPITKQQISDISMGSLFEKSIEKLIEERLDDAIKNKHARKEDINLNDLKSILKCISVWTKGKGEEVTGSWSVRNLATNIIACLYLLLLFPLLFLFLEMLNHHDREFIDLSLGFYTVVFIYTIIQFFLNRKDGIYALLLSPIIVLPVGYFLYPANRLHLYDTTMLMYLFSTPFLFSLLLKKNGDATWNHLRGGLLGLLKWKRHIFYYLWYFAWFFIAIYKNNHYHY